MFKIKNEKDWLMRREGMTLIEVMMVIGIIGIMSAVSVTSYVTSKKNVELETAAEELIAVLREAQNYSLTGKEITSSCSNYRVNIDGSSNYRLRTYNAAVGGSSCATLDNAYTFKNGVVPSAGGGYVNFAAPHASITRTAGSVVGTWYRITLSKGGEFHYVCFNNAGLIKKTINANCN